MIDRTLFNALASRSALARKLFDPRRDMNDECGYPRTESITREEYKELYDREAVATRVVEVLPMETWKVTPEVFEVADEDVVTEFEEAWSNIANDLRSNSWYQDEEGNPIWEYLLRLDILSGIGSFGALLLGVDDGADLRDPMKSGRKGSKLIYLRPFDESLVDITQYDTDERSPRYGQPILYNVKFGDPTTDDYSFNTRQVHWTRVIHVADNIGSSEVWGVPRMRPVFNRLYDLRKLYGGSAEMFWRGGFAGISLETLPELGADVVIDKDAIRNEMENFMNGLQRYLALSGMTAKSLAPQVSDPTGQINVQIEAICVRLGIPKRIFVGSERGELASSQDDKTWSGRLKSRQTNHVTARIIIPLIDRLIWAGILPEPEGYSVVWPDMHTPSDLEKMDIAVKKTEAMAKYVSGNVESIMSPVDYLTRVLELSQEDAESIMGNVEEALKEKIPPNPIIEPPMDEEVPNVPQEEEEIPEFK